MTRAFTIIIVLLLLVSCDREYKNCFEAELPKARETQVCNDLWQFRLWLSHRVSLQVSLQLWLKLEKADGCRSNILGPNK